MAAAEPVLFETLELLPLLADEAEVPLELESPLALVLPVEPVVEVVVEPALPVVAELPEVTVAVD